MSRLRAKCFCGASLVAVMVLLRTSKPMDEFKSLDEHINYERVSIFADRLCATVSLASLPNWALPLCDCFFLVVKNNKRSSAFTVENSRVFLIVSHAFKSAFKPDGIVLRGANGPTKTDCAGNYRVNRIKRD